MGWPRFDPRLTLVCAGQARHGSGSIREPLLRQMEQGVRDRSAPNRPPLGRVASNKYEFAET
jgi:hypothetical protein